MNDEQISKDVVWLGKGEIVIRMQVQAIILWRVGILVRISISKVVRCRV